MTASKSRTRSATPSGTEAGTGAGTTVGTERTDRVANLLEARSVAVVGASDRPGPARNVVSNLGRAGFAGPVYLINAKRASVAGMPVTRSTKYKMRAGEISPHNPPGEASANNANATQISHSKK